MIVRNFRQWWQVPRNIRERKDHRQVTFLELFYDLVYVVLIAELTHALSANVATQHLAEFAFLFVVVFVAWINGTLYHDIHGNNDIRTRVFTFLQMFTVAAMAVFAHDAFGETSSGFALAFAAFQAILTVLWWRTGVHDPNHRPLSRPYSALYLVSALAFSVSAFIPIPSRFYIWFAAAVGSFVLPLVIFLRWRDRPELKEQIELSQTATASLVERLGLFTIIVLGEVIVAVVQGIAGKDELTVEIGLVGGLGMVIAFGLWWLYFDFVSHRHPKTTVLWMYAHLPVAAGIAAVGAAILNVIDHAERALPSPVSWLLVGAIAVVLVGTAFLIQTLQETDIEPRFHRVGRNVMIVAALIIFALGLLDLQIVPLLVVVVCLLVAPVFLAFLSRINITEST